MITIYTDGSSSSNPGLSGWAYVIIPKLDSEQLIVAAGGSPHSTSNRMELTAVIEALTEVEQHSHQNPGEPITLYTDSQYVSRAINEEWLDRWIMNNFKNIKNQDLWLKLYRLICKLNIQVQWVRAHSNNTYNELADRLAKEARLFQGIPQVYPIKILNSVEVLQKVTQ